MQLVRARVVFPSAAVARDFASPSLDMVNKQMGLNNLVLRERENLKYEISMWKGLVAWPSG